MTSEALYEQYKDALKRGHVASLRGRLDDALLAYAEAAAIAPERSTPHSSAGTALLRRKRPAEAIRHYEVALAMAPHDEAALLGRAQALATLERRPEAADAYDTLAEVRAGSGKLADAVDAARRGLEMAEGRERRRTLERLIKRLRASEPDEPGRLALDRALRVLDGEAVPMTPAAPVLQPHIPETHAAAHAHRASLHARADALALGHELGAHAVARSAPGPAADATAPHDAPVSHDAVSAQAMLAAQATPETPAAPAPEAASAQEPAADADAAGSAAVATPVAAAIPVPVRRPLDRTLAPGVTIAELEARAHSTADAGLPGPALDAHLDLAAAYRRDGHVDAALDACYAALTYDPDGIGLHLAFVELYDECGWTAAADDKLALVESLARLDADPGALAQVAAARAGRD